MRVPYLQTEVFRFSETPIDSDTLTDGEEREGKLNAWPLDENEIDQVGAGLTSTGGWIYTMGLTAANITETAVLEKQGDLGEEDDVLIGYHAIEFLLWGQDYLHPETQAQNGTPKGAHNDAYFTNMMSNGGGSYGALRRKYLEVITDLLITDLKVVRDAWKPDGSFVSNLKSDVDKSMKNILTGIGSFSKGEIGGERFNGITNGDQEEEHSCFSDTTHQDFFYDVQGMINVLNGSYSYTRTTGATTTVTGQGLKNLDDTGDSIVARMENVKNAFKDNDGDPTNGNKVTIDNLPDAVKIFAFEELTQNIGGDADKQTRKDYYINTVQKGIVQLATDLTEIAKSLDITILPLGPGEI